MKGRERRDGETVRVESSGRREKKDSERRGRKQNEKKGSDREGEE